MADGWKCPVCGRGVAPDVRTCEHGGQIAAPGSFPLHGIPVSPSFDCGCPSNTVCMSVACPRRIEFVCKTANGGWAYI